MLANIAYSVLWLGFLLSVYCIIAAYIGLKRYTHASWLLSAQRAMLVIFPLLSISLGILLVLLINEHYEIAYVANVVSQSSPLFYRIVALWAGQEGSICFWTWLLSAVSFIFFLKPEKINILYLPWLYIIVSATLGFFIVLLLGWENPFQKLWMLNDGRVISSFFQPANSTLFVPRDGNGINPLLRHWGMIFHPPLLYLGFVTFVIPYAYVMAVLIVDPLDETWVKKIYSWIMISWLFLSGGLFLGARWAYDVLGWGGYWGWDPVEIAALLPWLSMTAYIHSSIAQVKRKILKRWNISLILLTFILVILGTFISRSGLITSVHAFASSTIGIAFFIFLCFITIWSIGVLYYRWEFLEDEVELEAFISREVLFIISNILFICIIGVCLWGILFPILSEVLMGNTITVSSPYYEKTTTPLFITVVFLMVLTPFISWKKGFTKELNKVIILAIAASLLLSVGLLGKESLSFTPLLALSYVFFILTLSLYGIFKDILSTWKLWKEGKLSKKINIFAIFLQKSGGKLIHIGIGLIALGIVGIGTLQVEKQITLASGESAHISSYSLKYEKSMAFSLPDSRNVIRSVLKVNKGNHELGELYPRKDYYINAQQIVTVPSIHSTWRNDVYVILLDWQNSPVDKSVFKIYINPFAMWLWIGSFIVLFATAILILRKVANSSISHDEISSMF